VTKDEQAQKFVDYIVNKNRKELDKAELDILVYGRGFIMMTEDGMKHIPYANTVRMAIPDDEVEERREDIET